MVNGWFDRLFSATKQRTWSEQEEHAQAGETKKDYIWNSAGLAIWGMMFPLFTIFVTQRCGTELAGMFSLAFVTSQVLMIIANFGVRTYQASDVQERHTFFEYQIARWVTCIIMLLVGLFYFGLRGYTGDMYFISLGILLFRFFDCLSDVYEGRLQQKDKLYLAGISQTLRSAISFIAFSIFLLIFGNVGLASVVFAIASGAVFLLFTLPITLFETKRSYVLRFKSLMAIFKQCSPLFLVMFLYTFVDSIPNFSIDALLDYTNQLYFNTLYFPAQFVLLLSSFIYKPLILRLADVWADSSMRQNFGKLVVRIACAIAGVTAVALVFFATLGIPLFGLLYGIDFESMRALCLTMIVAGGITGGIDFLYQLMTITRNQTAIIRAYFIALIIAIIASILLILIFGLTGAVLTYLATMCVLFILLSIEYRNIWTKVVR